MVGAVIALLFVGLTSTIFGAIIGTIVVLAVWRAAAGKRTISKR
jgi:hypothetical protein